MSRALLLLLAGLACPVAIQAAPTPAPRPQAQRELLEDLCTQDTEAHRLDWQCQRDDRHGNQYEIRSCEDRNAAVQRLNQLQLRWWKRYQPVPCPDDPCGVLR